MASPFKVFRKRQKLMLAFLGVLVMIGFVVLPALMQTMDQPQRTSSTIVATTVKYDDLDRSRISVLRWQRQTTIRFLESLARRIVLAEGSPMAIQLAFHHMAPSGNVSPTSDEALVEKWLLVKHAEELGLAVNDEAVQMFIIDLSQGLVSGEQVQELLETTGIGVNELFSALREEMLVMRVRRMFSQSLRGAPSPFSLDGLPTATPAQRWDYFQRLHRKVTIESLALSVSDFIDDVADPDESTLLAFFDEHKARLPDRTSPDPGFRVPEKVAVEYLKAEYEPLFERAVEAVPQEEVAKYYEEHKEEYKQEELPAGPDEESPAAESEANAESETSAETEEPADREAPADEEMPADEEPPAEEEKPADEEAAAADEEVPAEEVPPAEEEEPADGEASAEPETPDESEPMEEPKSDATDSDDGASAVNAVSPFRLASLSQQREAEAPEEETAAPDDPAPEPEEPPAEPQSEEPEKEATASEASPKKDAPPAETPPAGTSPAETPPAETPPTEESQEPPPPKYLPLEKVEAEIRRTLARDRVKTQIDDVFNRVQELMRKYRNARLLHEAGEGEAPPAEPDLADAFRLLLVDESGGEVGKVTRDFAADPEGVKLLVRSKTGLVSAIDVAEKHPDLGQSLVENRTVFTDYAYGENWQAYQPTQSGDSDGNRYVFWKVDDAKERTPEFEEVRDQVRDVWKEIEARTKAVEQAEKLAEEARGANKSLAETFADRQGFVVTESEPFSWVTYGNMPPMWAQGPPSLSEIKSVDMPGNDLMRVVFGLKRGEIGTAVNQPQTAAYVVRVTDSNPLPDVLWRMFLSESYFGYFRVASHDLYAVEEAWIDGIKSEVGFAWDPEWERQPGLMR